MPSTSSTLGGAFKRNLPKREDPDAANIDQRRNGKTGASSSWMQSLHRVSSAK